MSYIAIIGGLWLVLTFIAKNPDFIAKMIAIGILIYLANSCIGCLKSVGLLG